MYSIGIAATLLGVCCKTLRRWDKNKKITCFRTLGGHRRFPLRELKRILHINKEPIHSRPIEKKCALYARVSSHKQSKRGDLDRQIMHLQQYAHSHHLAIYRVYKDIGSGLNTNRKGLWRLMKDAKKGKFSTILLNFKDRLTRFGYHYLESYLSEYNVCLECVHELDDKSPESELVEDLVAIVHSFSGKLYRMRRTEKQKIEKPSLS